MLAGTVMGMALLYLAAPLIVLTMFAHWNIPALFYAAGACALMAYTCWPTLRLYGRAPWEAALLPVAAGFVFSAFTLGVLLALDLRPKPTPYTLLPIPYTVTTLDLSML